MLSTLLLVGNAFANTYLGGYPNTSIYYKVDKVWMKTKFVVEENLLDCNINSILSTAGSTGSVVTGWVYQGGVWMDGADPSCDLGYNNGVIIGSGQVWYNNMPRGSITPILLSGQSTTEHVYNDFKWINNKSKLHFYFEVLKKNGNVVIKTGTLNRLTGDNSQYFMAGTTTYTHNGNNYLIKFLQFGIESLQLEGYWDIEQFDMAFVTSSGTTKYLSSFSAYATQGPRSYITYINGNPPFVVGGETYYNTKAYYYNNSNKPKNDIEWYYAPPYCIACSADVLIWQ